MNILAIFNNFYKLFVFWVTLFRYVKSEKKEEDRVLYVGIVGRKTKMELEPPAPPYLTNYLL